MIWFLLGLVIGLVGGFFAVEGLVRWKARRDEPERTIPPAPPNPAMPVDGDDLKRLASQGRRRRRPKGAA